jgi:hypothetical protein
LIDANVVKRNPPQHDEQQVDHAREHRPVDAQVGNWQAALRLGQLRFVG